MSQSYPLRLASLNPREAIADTLFRVLLSIDQHDAALFDSVWAGDNVAFEIHDDKDIVLPSLALIRTHVFDKAGAMDTTHNVTNLRIDVQEGADTASLTANSLAQHCPPGRGKEPNGPKLLVAGLYSVDLVKNEAGEWRIKKCGLNVIWKQGDASVMH